MQSLPDIIGCVQSLSDVRAYVQSMSDVRALCKAGLMSKGVCEACLVSDRLCKAILMSEHVCEAYLMWMALAPRYLEGSADPVPRKFTCIPNLSLPGLSTALEDDNRNSYPQMLIVTFKNVGSSGLLMSWPSFTPCRVCDK